MKFWIHQLRLGSPWSRRFVTISIVRNDNIARYSKKRVSRLLEHDDGFLITTLRVGPFYLNIDARYR